MSPADPPPSPDADPAGPLLRRLSRAAHDLRQPFSSMGIFLHLLEQDLTTPRQKQIASRLRESVETGRDLLNALLDLSALETGRVAPAPGPVPLEDLLLRVAEAHAPVADARGLRFDYVPTAAWVLSDGPLLERIVRILVGNAMTFTRVGEGRGRVVLGARRRGAHTVVQVWDDGPGVAAADLDRIFEPFERLDLPRNDRSRGLGLGLALARGTADLLGHRIGVRSRPGRGSVFEVEAPTVRLGAAVAAATPAPGGVLVLIEDDALQRLALEALLADWGWDCVATPDLDGALAALDRGGRVPAAVISDLRLGGRAAGDDAVRHLRERFGPQVRGIVVTGDTDPGLRARLTDAGLVVVHKPIDTAVLRAALGPPRGPADG